MPKREVVEMEDNLMTVKVVRGTAGEYEISIGVSGGTINTWSLGHDEAVAKGKVSTILDSYMKGLEFVQGEVRKVFAEEEDKAE